MENIKISKLEIENVKRVKAVKIEPTKSGLTVIGGNNEQGKTSVLDAIAWALGGNKFKPAEPQRVGSVVPPAIDITLSNGLRVERRGKNSDLKVTDPAGEKAGQMLLDSFVEEFALDLPKFMAQTAKEKANTLLRILGIEDRLMELTQAEQTVYNQRRTIGQIADQKKKYAAEMDYFPDAPKEPILATEIIKQQQTILLKNAENQKKRQKLAENQARLRKTKERIAELHRLLEIAITEENQLLSDIEVGEKDVLQLQDESTEALEENLKNIEVINVQVRKNLEKDKAEEDAEEYTRQYDDLTTQLEKVRQSKIELLDGADLPLPDLSIKDGELTYKGFTWSDMSGAQQLKVATAIVRKLNPQCGFVLLDKLEQMDLDTLNEFGQWLEQEGLQAIATRVSKGDECQIIIEDGYAVINETLTHDPEAINEKAKAAPSWAPGKY